MNTDPITLEGRHVRLAPLERAHVDALCAVGLDPELWRWTAGHVEDAAGMRGYVEKALERRERGEALPFVMALPDDGRVVGCTRFGALAPEHRRVEIGWTWIARPWQRTAVNTEAKYLMLRHAFETWGCVRVELKTDARNAASRRAILRLGATEEGTLRNHLTTSRGHVRDTVYFSVVDSEWPAVRARLEARLTRPRADGRAPPGRAARP